MPGKIDIRPALRLPVDQYVVCCYSGNSLVGILGVESNRQAREKMRFLNTHTDKNITKYKTVNPNIEYEV